ncbi:hypothetical protein cyc_06565 [Cyclospora cayetanensis]|uniref:Ribosomal protein L7Ae/L30e/S12e/Gadd45 domain-containing protein n=1 Tax=Cyclospora cayetanensis TaxID=88456 RepID=A0A1D3D3F2_9EIME|nr:hypothetical protein cyc_06565 [Cyclospora cayetanensis]
MQEEGRNIPNIPDRTRQFCTPQGEAPVYPLLSGQDADPLQLLASHRQKTSYHGGQLKRRGGSACHSHCSTPNHREGSEVLREQPLRLHPQALQQPQQLASPQHPQQHELQIAFFGDEDFPALSASTHAKGYRENKQRPRHGAARDIPSVSAAAAAAAGLPLESLRYRGKPLAKKGRLKGMRKLLQHERAHKQLLTRQLVDVSQDGESELQQITDTPQSSGVRRLPASLVAFEPVATADSREALAGVSGSDDHCANSVEEEETLSGVAIFQANHPQLHKELSELMCPEIDAAAVKLLSILRGFQAAKCKAPEQHNQAEPQAVDFSLRSSSSSDSEGNQLELVESTRRKPLLVLLAANVERTITPGGITDQVDAIFSAATAARVPVGVVSSRGVLKKGVQLATRQSCVCILDAQGAEALLHTLLNLIVQKQRKVEQDATHKVQQTQQRSSHQKKQLEKEQHDELSSISAADHIGSEQWQQYSESANVGQQQQQQ